MLAGTQPMWPIGRGARCNLNSHCGRCYLQRSAESRLQSSAGSNSSKMRILFCLVISLSLVGSALGRSYSTSFPLTENPISEGGVWSNGSVYLDWTDMETTPGHAFGTQVNTGDANDSLAELLGSWGANQEVQATVHDVGDLGGQNFEVELHLRATVAAHSVKLYEVDCAPGYIALVRWNGALNDYSILNNGLAYGIADGDTVRATISGTSPVTISIYKDGSLQYTTTDNTARKLTSGAPGMGWYTATGTPVTNRSDLSWTDYFANDGTVDDPTFSPPGGSYDDILSLTISDIFPGAVICYTTDGSTPTTDVPGTCSHGDRYSSSIPVLTSETVKAIGTARGYANSGVASATYNIGNQRCNNIKTTGVCDDVAGASIR